MSIIKLEIQLEDAVVLERILEEVYVNGWLIINANRIYPIQQELTRQLDEIRKDHFMWEGLMVPYV